MEGPFASAVVLPDQEIESPPPAPSPTSLKRRQSSIAEHDAKRPRINSDDVHPDRRRSIVEPNAPAPAPKGRERGRERRLFGAALGALSQNSTTAGQKRRSEIEKRQQAQRKVQEEETEQRKLERQARRKVQRLKEQKHFDKESMRIRHQNLLAMAHFLQTTSEPRLYYKPWETSPAEDDRIRDQIAGTNELIRRELEEHQASQEERPERERRASREEHDHGNADAIVSGKVSNAETPQPATTNGGPTDNSTLTTEDPEQRGDHDATGHPTEAVSEERAEEDAQDDNITNQDDAAEEPSKGTTDENGEEMVEAAEDTVIY